MKKIRLNSEFLLEYQENFKEITTNNTLRIFDKFDQKQILFSDEFISETQNVRENSVAKESLQQLKYWLLDDSLGNSRTENQSPIYSESLFTGSPQNIKLNRVRVWTVSGFSYSQLFGSHFEFKTRFGTKEIIWASIIDLKQNSNFQIAQEQLLFERDLFTQYLEFFIISPRQFSTNQNLSDLSLDIFGETLPQLDPIELEFGLLNTDLQTQSLQSFFVLNEQIKQIITSDDSNNIQFEISKSNKTLTIDPFYSDPSQTLEQYLESISDGTWEIKYQLQSISLDISGSIIDREFLVVQNPINSFDSITIHPLFNINCDSGFLEINIEIQNNINLLTIFKSLRIWFNPNEIKTFLKEFQIPNINVNIISTDLNITEEKQIINSISNTKKIQIPQKTIYIRYSNLLINGEITNEIKISNGKNAIEIQLVDSEEKSLEITSLRTKLKISESIFNESSRLNNSLIYEINGDSFSDGDSFSILDENEFVIGSGIINK